MNRKLEVDRVLNSKQVPWDVKEKLRKNETCFTCINYGGDLFCSRDIPREDNETPLTVSDNLTCGDWCEDH